MSTATQTLLALPMQERLALADQLHASVPANWQKEATEAWLKEAELRAAEMEANPGLEITHESFLARFKTCPSIDEMNLPLR
ncbi:putative addiction module component, TIGR02574 family [Prosthecobacter debontii]|uniref:Putative addiction module component, TIGR02574 family n=1 Tax=Prosthecobacter debontii TaxID=48467 RepID=A0A1T4WJX3_9BACT|nr:addiction module protein [Prosthecobacter debontii]SKA77479.1 putative addiction module component, TIGR02574 family [Prosthecobacter debontii]